MSDSKTALWLQEFDADFAVPDEVTNDPDLKDTSWHNNAAPSFNLVRDVNEKRYDLRLWVNHPVQAMREFSDMERFVVYDNEYLLYQGEDVAEAVRILKSRR
jgi:hypothetical protein